MAESTFKSMIDQMEDRIETLYIKMEGYRDIQSELNTLTKAIKVMKGEKLTPGPTQDKSQSKGALLAQRLPDLESDAPARKLRSTPNYALREALPAILRANSKGLTVKEMILALAKKGVTADSVMVHNAMRGIKTGFRVVDVRRAPSGQMNIKVYALNKEG